MRILFTFVGGIGHFEPLIPIARAAESAGHTVAFAGQASTVPRVRASGFTGFCTGPDFDGSSERSPLLELSREREDRALRESFGRRAARDRARDILTLSAEWLPDLVVCDELDFGSMVAAERLGLPHASVLVIAAGSFVRKELLSEPLNELRVAHGLPPDPDLDMLSRYLVLSPFPPGFRDPASPLPATAHPLRTLAPGTDGDHVERPWWTTPRGAPTVYFTLGTVFNTESGDLFSRVLMGLRECPINLVATVGRAIDPAEFGPQPAHVHIARYIDQASILSQCSAVVSHGGSGTVAGALAHGLPQVVLPMGADQPMNAERCAKLGAGKALDAMTTAPEIVREAVSAVLTDPTYRLAAELMRDELAAMPGSAHAVALLEKLAAEKHPVLSAEQPGREAAS